MPPYSRRSGLGVYPHVCGGAFMNIHVRPSPRGLSPRVRGSLTLADPNDSGMRSIPTCAGEPLAVVIKETEQYHLVGYF